MEELKKLEYIILPDSRNSSFVLLNRQTGQQRKYCLEDLYREVESTELHGYVPEEVRSQFNVARNLAIYTWFCYSFHNVSILKAFSTVEMALRIRLGKSDTREGLRKLIKNAVDAGLIKDGHFSHIKGKITDPESTSYVESLPDVMARLRNVDAHGSTNLYPGSVLNLRICADFINQIFGKTEGTS